MIFEPSRLRLVFLVFFGAVIGCSGGHPALEYVEGVVQLDGKPLDKGLVTFTPSAGRSASGWIQPDGTFELGTYAEGDGALAGDHRITVTGASKAATSRPDFDNPRPKRNAQESAIPLRYSNPNDSGLTFTVESGGDNQVTLDLVSQEGQ